jgi:hypothetical protein
LKVLISMSSLLRSLSGALTRSLSLVNDLDLECDQVEIKAACLHGDLEETTYLSPPESSGIPADKLPVLSGLQYLP